MWKRKRFLVAVLLMALAIGLLGPRVVDRSEPQGEVSLSLGQKVVTIGSVTEAAGSTDYTFDGVADNVQLQAALNALPATGGRLVIVSAVQVNLAALTSVTRAINNVVIEGSGNGTYFVGDGVTALFTAGGNNWRFVNLRTDAGGINMGATTGWTWTNVTVDTTFYATRVPTSASPSIFTMPVGLLLGSTAYVVSNDEPALIRAAATVLSLFTSRVQVANGSADQVEIAAAYAALPAGGGRLVLSSGVFVIDAATYDNFGVAFNTANTVIEGQGPSTILRKDGSPGWNGDLIITGDFAGGPATDVTNVTVRNLALDGDSDGGEVAGAIGINAQIDGTDISNITFEYLTVYDFSRDGPDMEINAANVTGVIRNITVANNTVTNVRSGIDFTNNSAAIASGLSVHHNFVRNWTTGYAINVIGAWTGTNIEANTAVTTVVNTHGIYVADTAAAAITNTRVANNSVSGVSGAGRYSYWLSGVDGATFTGNVATTASYPLHIDRSNQVAAENIIVSGNHLRTTGAGFAGLYVSARTNGLLVTSNYIESLDNYPIRILGASGSFSITGNALVTGDASTEALRADNSIYGLFANNLHSNVNLFVVTSTVDADGNGTYDGVYKLPVNEKRILVGSLVNGVADAFAFTRQNPFGNKVLVDKVVVEVTTPGGTPASVLDVDVVAAAGDTGDDILDGVNLNASAVYDSRNTTDAGANGKMKPILWDENGGASDWVTGKILVADAGNLNGKYYIWVTGR